MFAARRIAPFAGFAGALVWVLGLRMSAAAGAILPTDGEYFWMGLVGAALGPLLAPIVLSVAPTRILRILGLVIAFALLATGITLSMAARGFLGETAPGWVVPASSVAPLALFAWISGTSYQSRRLGELGPRIFAVALLNALAVGIGIVAWIDPYTHTNATVLIDGVMALVIFACVPAWLTTVSVHLWRFRGSAHAQIAV